MFSRKRKIRHTIFLTMLMMILLWNDNHSLVCHADFVEEQAQVLVINAYHQGYGWTDGQVEGILRTLKNSEFNPIISVEYLDAKRYPSQENLTSIVETLKIKYSRDQFDVVIATDDIGMQFAIDNREALFAGTPIIFTGVFEDSANRRVEGIDQITGVYESIDPEGTLEIIRILHPQLEHIYVINDETSTGKDVEAEILEALRNLETPYSYELTHGLTYDEITSLLENPKANSVVFMGTYHEDASGERIENINYVNHLSNMIDIPIYSTYEYLYGYGIVGGSLLSGRIQGEEGAHLALEVLRGTDVDTISEYSKKTVFTGIDYTMIEKYDLNYKELDLVDDIINKPDSAFEKYMWEILTGLALIVFLFVFIIILSINIAKRRKVQYELELNNNELLEAYENIAASEEELYAQNEELIDQQEKINFLAYYDKLTNLPNRNAVDEKLRALFDHESNDHFTVIMIIDIDNFNYINTAYGHRIGDSILQNVGDQFKELQKDGYFIGRIAGDEFFLMKQMEAHYEVASILSKIDSVFKTPFIVHDKEILLTKSIGYTIHPDDGLTYDEILSRTDLAKKKMKSEGKGLTSRFNALMNKEMADKIILTKALKQALKNHEMYIMLQPQFDIVKEKIVGFEALVRWNSHIVGQVPPDRFIQLAEETSEIIEIGYFVLEEALKFIASNCDEFTDDFRLSVNISVLQLLRQDFIDRVKHLISLYDVNPVLLEFEITESVLIESFEVVNERLIRLKMMGITIALDDFGTGYSSLTYLEKLPISTLKIDKAFIDGIILEGEEHFFTKSIIDIGHRLGFRVIAEGVEETRQVEYLKRCNSHIIQGYWFSKPLLCGEAIELYHNNQLED